MKLFAFLTVSASASVTYTAYKESGFTRAQALADCEARGERLANVYSADEQAALNAEITNAGGEDRAFWLGMWEDGPNPVKTEIKDSDGNPLGYYDGWRADQPSNKLNHPNDKHTTNENEDCVRQFGLEGWNDAICSRTWSGAKRDNVAMGHICEARTVQHPIQHTNDFEDTLVEWIETFLAPTFPNMVARWEENKINPFATHIRNIMARNCAKNHGDPTYTGISSVDANGDALGQLQTIITDVTAFFDTFIPDCLPRNYNKKTEKLTRWQAALTDKYNSI